MSKSLLLLISCCFLFFTGCFSVPRVSVQQQMARKERVESLLRQGVLLLRENSSESVRLAESSFRAVSEILPLDPRGYDGLGCVGLRFGEKKKARKYFKEALLKDSSYELAYVHLAFIDELEGKRASAAENYRKALLLNPLNHKARFNYGIFLRDEKSFAAKEEFKKFILIESAGQ